MFWLQPIACGIDSGGDGNGMGALVASVEELQELVPGFAELSEAAREALAELPPKRARFAYEYTVDCDPRQAYIRAGYSRKTAETNSYRVLRDRRVMRAVECLLDLKVQRLAIDRDWIEDQYISLYHKCLSRNDTSVARQCLRDLAEHHGMFVKQLAIVRTGEIERRLEEGRKRVIEGEARELPGEPVTLPERPGNVTPSGDPEPTPASSSTDLTDPIANALAIARPRPH